MENLEYFRILVTGYFKHGIYLKDHIYREFKKAEKNFITKDEFFARCNYIIKWLENEFDKRVNEQKKDYYDVLHCLKHEPETVNLGEIPTDQHIIEIENRLKTICRNDFIVNLRHIRGIPADYYMDFQQELDYSDLQYIETAIKQAIGKAILDEIYMEALKPEQPKGNKKSPPPKYETIESIFNDTKNIQKVIDCLIDYETLNENGELIKKAYHVSAISEALKIKGIINKKVSMTQRNKLFAEKFCIDVSDRTARAENKEHETLLTEYKGLFDTVDFL